MSTKNILEKTDYRQKLINARRIVIKVGSRLLARENENSQQPNIKKLIQQIANLKHNRKEVVFVTSGAIGTGMQILGLKRKPAVLAELQMAAAVGQGRLMANYATIFQEYNCIVGQILLTHDDLRHRLRHLNARRTILTMLENNVIPIVNENDAVAVDEIKFGDNDLLSALVTQLIDADLLIMLTTTDGLKAPGKEGREERVPFLASITDEIFKFVHGKGGEISTGGMASKLEWARVATKAGADVVIADGRKENILARIINGEDTGTLIAASRKDTVSINSNKKRWIAFFHKVQGTLIIDDGAKKALLEKGKSLLPIGVKEVRGTFPAGAAVEICSIDNSVLARGLVSYSSDEIEKIMGKKSKEIKAILGLDACDEEVVHRNNMALLKM